MNCPKCNASIGIHFSEYTLLTHSDACGMHCYICGYWMNINRGQERVGRLKRPRRKNIAV